MFDMKRIDAHIVGRSMGRAIVAAILLMTLGSVTPSYGQITVKDLTGSDEVGPYYQDIEDAIKRYQARDIDGARRLLQEARKKSTRLAPPEAMLARMLFASNQRPGAYAELERAVTNNPDDPEPFLLLADIAFAEGRLTESGMLYGQAIQTADKYSENPRRKKELQGRGHAGIAAVHEARKQWKTALPHLEAWAKLDPDNSAPHIRLGRTLFELGQRKEAYSELQAAAKADPKSRPAEFLLATLYYNAKDPQAEKWIKAGLARNKGFAAQSAAAQLYLQMNQPKQALPYAEAAVKLDPKDVDANFVRGLVARLLKDYETAEKYFERAHLLSPSNFQAINQLTLTLVEQDNEEDRKRAYEFAEWLARQAARTPQANEATGTLGWVQYRTGRTAEGERTLTSLAAAGGFANADTAYFVANVLKDQGRTADALKVLELALQGDRAFGYRDEAEALRKKLKAQDTPATSSSEKPGALPQ